MTEKSMDECLNAIGQAIADEIDGDPDGAFLYAEAEPGAIYEALFLDRGNSVEYIEASAALSTVLFEAWYASGPGKAWATLSYAIVGKAFDASFQYPDEISNDEGPEERRRRVLKERYGDKPIKYPTPPSDLIEL
ncbi:hypothetical protein [Sphingomonas sp. NIBR02145]|uniref:hypothetical protein n=1 Tax=Sphingomonas sp. NIBR02145 TaxID=3014784 RepID=UPI0022B2D880|nr:hypothetical protein [Sphingomonas sp. NIBR02145]WHU01138.1 hypothetical protein O3305_13050 [Sphingomonas sp. NIBR02145]